MASVKTNVLANLAGKGIAALVSLLLVPVYIRYLGIEAYGLVGVFALLTVLFGILDLGVSPTISRELARLATKPDAAQQSRDLVRTLESFYWGIGVVIGVLVMAGAPLIARRWVHASSLSPAIVQRAIVLMGIIMALQWPFSLYEGGLIGLQRLVLNNGIQAGLQVVRGVGAIAVLAFISPTVTAFFVWQLVMSAAGTVAVVAALWKCMPRGDRPRYSAARFHSIRVFAAEMSATTAVSAVLSQMDKVILSRRLSLADFGYYNLAVVTASGLSYLIYPIYGALFPRLSQFFALRDEGNLARAYHAGCQAMTVTIAPVALTVAFFSSEIMTIWTRNAVTAQHTAFLVTVLVIGTMLNGFVCIPYMLQLAAGWARLSLYTNLIALCIQVPLLFFLIARYGAVGAAFASLALNAASVLIGTNFMYTRLLRGQRWRWYVSDMILPCAAALAVIVPIRIFLPPLSSTIMLQVLVAIVALAFVAAVMAAPESRSALLDLLSSVQEGDRLMRDATRRRAVPLARAMKDSLRRWRVSRAAWTSYRAAQVMREYRRRREVYARIAGDRKVVYSEEGITADVRRRLSARGYTPSTKQHGDVHTFACFPSYGWARHLLPDLWELGPVTHFDYQAIGYSVDEFSRCDARSIKRRDEMSSRIMPFLRAAHAERPVDWVFWYGGGQDTSPVVVRQITEELGIPVVNMSLDDKQGWAGATPSGWRAGAVDITSAFDLYATSARVACEWHMIEGGRPLYMPEGFDASAYRPRATERDLPVSFVGVAYGFRMSVVEGLRDCGIPVAAFGSGWPAGKAKDIIGIFNRSLINLGMGGIEYSEDLTNVKGRDFEIPGTGGGMYLTSFNPDLATHFHVGTEIVCYTSREEMVELIRHYLARPEEADAIAGRARERSLREHRWLHRYEKMLRLLGVLK